MLSNCQIEIIGEQFGKKTVALAVQKGSPLKQQLGDVIMYLLNTRCMEDLHEKWFENNAEKKQCQRVTDGLGFQNTGGALIIMWIGMAASLTAIGLEYWFFAGRRQSTAVVDIINNTNTQIITEGGEVRESSATVSPTTESGSFQTTTTSGHRQTKNLRFGITEPVLMRALIHSTPQQQEAIVRTINAIRARRL